MVYITDPVIYKLENDTYMYISTNWLYILENGRYNRPVIYTRIWYIYTVGVKSMSPVKYWTNIYNYTLYFHSGQQQNSILLFLDYIRIMT